MKLMQISRGWACVSLVALTSGSRASAQQLWTVDDDAPADFTSIQDAVNAAADGDVILVRPGSYAGFQIVSKGLAVIGDPSAAPTLTEPIAIAQTAAGQTVVLAGLSQVPTLLGLVSALNVQSCAGAVRIEDCAFRGQDASANVVPAPVGALVEQSSDVVFSASTAIGGKGTETSLGPPYSGLAPQGGGHGGALVGSQVALFQTNLFAGAPATSATTSNLFGTIGGGGLQVDASFVFASHARMQGGQGGNHSLSQPMCSQSSGSGYCGNGGHGLWLVGGASNVSVQQPDLAGGPGGTTNCFPNLFYFHGEIGHAFYRTAAGSLSKRVPGERRAMTAPALAAGTTTIDATITGVAGDLVYLVVETTPHFHYDAALHGVWSLSYPPQPAAVPDGVVAGNGSVNIQLTLPALQAGQEARTYFVQPYVVDLAGQVFAGTPRSVTLVH